MKNVAPDPVWGIKSSGKALERELLTERRPSEVVGLLDNLPELSRYVLYLATSDERLKRVLIQYATTWQKVHPKADGQTLRELGIPPGPVYREILTALRGAWLDEMVVDEAGEQAFLNELVQEIKR